MAKVEFRNVSKEYTENVRVVDNFNLNVNDGEFLVLVGPSGCGKSTTLRLLAGLEEITEGEIFIDNKCVNKIPPKDRDISMVFQNYALYPHMTVFKNMAFGLKLRKFPKKEILKLVNKTAKILNIEDLLERKPKQLSGGQKQRAALGRAIIRQPSVFLFDEPLSNLDAKLRVHMRTEIKKLHNRLKTTMVYVTHDQTEAMTMGDRIVVMKNGIVQQLGAPMNIYNDPANLFVAGFIGSPVMNLLNANIENGQLIINNGKIKIPLLETQKKVLRSYNDREIIAGIRPENITIENNGPNYVGVKLFLDVFETLGSEILLYLNDGKSNIICKTDKYDPKIKQTDTLTVFFNVDKMHFFEKESGNKI